MSHHHRGHHIVGSEADEPRPIAYMRSGRHKSALSSRGVALLLIVALVACLGLAVAVLPQ